MRVRTRSQSGIPRDRLTVGFMVAAPPPPPPPRQASVAHTSARPLSLPGLRSHLVGRARGPEGLPGGGQISSRPCLSAPRLGATERLSTHVLVIPNAAPGSRAHRGPRGRSRRSGDRSKISASRCGIFGRMRGRPATGGMPSGTNSRNASGLRLGSSLPRSRRRGPGEGLAPS